MSTTKEEGNVAVKMSDESASSNILSLNNIKNLRIGVNEDNLSEWKKWWQSLEIYFLATNLCNASESRKIAVMLHSIGEKGLQIFNSFNLNINATTLKIVKQKFDLYFEPTKNITMYRYVFYKASAR